MAIERSSSVSLSVCPSVHPWMCPMERLTPPPHLVWLRNDGWWCFGSVVAYFVFEFCCREIFLCLFLFAVYAFIHKYGKRWTLNTEHWELYRKEMMAENKTNFFVVNNRKYWRFLLLETMLHYCCGTKSHTGMICGYIILPNLWKNAATNTIKHSNSHTMTQSHSFRIFSRFDFTISEGLLAYRV